jgi:acetyltransferase-like isoleucine patch superfamily enzyme
VTEAVFVAPQHISVGENVVINFHTWINGAGGVQIGDDVIMGPYVIVHSANHRFDRLDMPIREQGHEFNEVIIENNVWIGARALILPGTRIGAGSVIAAGAIISKVIPENSVVMNVNEIVRTRGR